MYKKNLGYTLLAVVILFVFLGTTIFIVDPLQQYRQASFYKPYFSNQRYMNPGMAKTSEYDTVVIGTSTSENFVPKNVDDILDVKSLKLPYNGGTVYEYNQILNTIIKTHKAKNIIIGLDYFSLSGDKERVRYVGLPIYLYDENIFNDYEYLFNINILIKEIGIKIISSNLFSFSTNRLNRENPYYWWKDGMASKKNVLDFWKNKGKVKVDFNVGQLNYENMEANFDYNILPYLRDNPDINFKIFLPPYSILYWMNIRTNSSDIKKILFFRKYLFKIQQKFPNTKLFDFQVDTKTVCDLNNYKDLIHYSVEINNRMLLYFRSNKFLVDNIDTNNKYLLDMMLTESKTNENRYTK